MEPEVHCHFHKSPPRVPILSQTYPVLPPHLIYPKIHLNFFPPIIYVFLSCHPFIWSTEWICLIMRKTLASSISKLYQKRKKIYINIYIRFLYIHIVMCTKFGWNRSRHSIVMSVWCYISFYFPRQILHWPETQKYRFFTIMWHRSWIGHSRT
jgi:hypothetical protein